MLDKVFRGIDSLVSRIYNGAIESMSKTTKAPERPIAYVTVSYYVHTNSNRLLCKLVARDGKEIYAETVFDTLNETEDIDAAKARALKLAENKLGKVVTLIK